MTPQDGHDLPSHDALVQILLNYGYLLKRAKSELHTAADQEQERPAKRPETTWANKPNINHTYQVRHPHKRPPLHNFEDDPHMAEITSLQTKEVENYRSAMSTMAEDIIVLRTQVVTLEAENSQLRIDLSLHQDLGRELLDDVDIMNKAEIADLITSLKFKLASERNKAASQMDRIQKLQNDLIKKNDSEKELLKLQAVHQQQQDELQRHRSCLVKMATLEATVKQQEKVIEKMGKALDGKLMEINKQSADRRLVVKRQRGDHRKEEIESALAAENARLREELDRIRQLPAPVIIQQSEQAKDASPTKEKLSLLSKLEKAEARARALEAQMVESTKLWGRQKQEMLTKLSEHRHGFVRTATTILYNVPTRSVAESLYQQSRRKQRPVK